MSNTNTPKNLTAAEVRLIVANYKGSNAPKLVRAYRQAEQRGDMRSMKRIRESFGRIHSREYRCPEDNVEFEMMLCYIGEPRISEEDTKAKQVNNLCLSSLRD